MKRGVVVSAWAVWTEEGVRVRGERVAGVPALTEIYPRARRPTSEATALVQLAHQLLSARRTSEGAAGLSLAEVDILLGTSRGSEAADREFWEGTRLRGPGHGSPSTFVYTLPTAPPAELTLALGFRGSLSTLAAGAASGLTSVARSAAHIAAGRSRAILCGSMESNERPSTALGPNAAGHALTLFLLEAASPAAACFPRIESAGVGWRRPGSDGLPSGATEDAALRLASALDRAEATTVVCASAAGHWARVVIGSNHPMSDSPSELRQKLKELIVTTLHLEGIDPSQIGDEEPLFSQGSRLGLDSLGALELLSEIEFQFKVRFESDGSAKQHFRSVATLADFVQSAAR